MTKISDKIIATTFLLFLVGMMVINIFTPDRVFSQRENRYLAKRPELTLRNVMSGRYSSRFEDYIIDEFIKRDQWVLIKSDLERLLLRTENNGIFFASDGYLFENFRRPGATLERNIGHINRFSLSFPDIPTHVVLVPNSATIYPEKLPLFASVYDQRLVLNQVQKGLSDSILFVPVHETLDQNREEYLYFRTDHHWTMRGAYYAYTQLAENLGFAPLSLWDCEIETVTDDFWGTYFSKANNRYLSSDYIEVIRPKNPVNVQIRFNDKEGVYDSLYFPKHLETRDKYSLFLDGNHPLTTITTDADNDRKLVVFKDSFAHNLIPFLAQHYQEIHIIDLRFFNNNLGQYILDHEIDQALFLYSISGFSNESTLVNFR